MHKRQGWLQAWECCQADSNTWESFTRSKLKLDSVHRVTTLRHLQEKGYQASSETETMSEASYLDLGEKKNWTVAQWSKVLFSDESKFSISFGNQGPRVWRKSGEAQNPQNPSPVWSFHSQWWFGRPCHLLVLVHCVFWSPQLTQPSTRTF